MFGLLVSVHEWGHLIFAKRAGMLAREFAIGFGPKIFSFTKNETLYTIRLIPAGGYVRVAGDDPEIIELKPGHHIGLEFNDEDKVNRIIRSVHEWCYLIFAKRAGMLAREFAIGFGPKIFSFTKNETLYTIRLIPAGGYVRVAGDDPEIIELKPGHHIGLEFNDEDKVNRII